MDTIFLYRIVDYGRLWKHISWYDFPFLNWRNFLLLTLLCRPKTFLRTTISFCELAILLFSSLVWKVWCNLSRWNLSISRTSALHRSSRNEIAFVPIGPGFERYSRFVLWAGWRLKSYHVTQLECGAQPKRCGIDLTSLSGARDHPRKNALRSMSCSEVAPVVAALVIRGEITRTTQQDWRRNLWSCDSLPASRCFVSVARLEQGKSFWCATCNPAASA